MLVKRPTLVLNSEIAKSNIARMKDKADQLGLVLRPHFKTHQSIGVGRFFKEAGCDRIAVSSLSMAKYFSSEWSDITLAFPVNIHEIDLINELNERIKLNLTVYNTQTLTLLEKALKGSANIYLKINIGNNRAGYAPEASEKILEFCNLVKQSSMLNLEGLVMHAGQSYRCRGKQEILDVHKVCMSKVEKLKELLSSEFPDLVYSYGDTPTCSVASSFPGIHELRPGNFVFYDLTQAAIGSCTLEDIAVALFCPVVGKQDDGQTVILYAGGVHLSKDVLVRADGNRSFGHPVYANGEGWSIMEDCNYLKGISQEHGVLKLSESDFEKINIGDCIGVLPVHSCMTADLMTSYITNDNIVINKM
jgi:D-serine deaminase-like pyridoxal phosphate-dependent protein